ncbi:MAG TPA: FtsQ-type POTRA domain-containing protein [Mycobacteriales bacterium]|nr:FtsQ-type POTRA domain-containing protein [Mycobacteriales bacterium]
MSGVRDRLPAWLRRGRTYAIAGAVLVVLAGAAVYLVGFSSVFAAKKVSVSGLHTLTRAQIVEAAQVPHDRPLARLDTGSIADRVGQLPGVARVDVKRAWPSGVHIVVTERTAVAFIRVGTAQWLVDAHGVAFQHLLKPIGGLPKITNTVGDHPDASTKAALGVAAHLPRWLQAVSLTISADSPDSVTLTLTGGRTVLWGSDSDNPDKASALSALLKQPGSNYDVSSPKVVTVH